MDMTSRTSQTIPDWFESFVLACLPPRDPDDDDEDNGEDEEDEGEQEEEPAIIREPEEQRSTPTSFLKASVYRRPGLPSGYSIF
jgi:hypothetical protein